ncbi:MULTISPECIES: hypothetical protein [Agrobacterium]|uniref:hypothetical protein n=1 Tax=Agrobacterium TaxID=357 RepID=UPI0004A0905B|nr:MULTISPECIES: hypothetical protein [Agrobacterium]KDR86539.1 hypothetical protein K538_09785 [Agrobacterium tumefaciens GW4]KVK46702.1 hypothetical protein L904_22780 [Agrobacterium sp. LY4]KVK46851.1 hypothetical protein L903_22930 [Agrobacterium sp. JL28]
MNIVEHPFPGAPKMEELQYRVFPESLENDPLVLFHATLPADYDEILLSGFKTAAQLGKSNGLASVSYAKQSSTALGHIRNRHKNQEVIIIAVQFQSLVARQGIVVNTSDIHVYDGTQPAIIGFCRVPKDYLFV